MAYLQRYSYADCQLPQLGDSNQPRTRILKLLQGISDVVCELHALAEGETYEAVSWCWGRQNNDSYIRIRGSARQEFKFEVSRNLESALRCLRLPDQTRNLWIDFICIDQSNVAERSEQVSLMAQIYGNAERVCVWLGEGDDRSNRALNFITNRVLKLQDFDRLVKDGSTAEDWKALTELMMKPWFTRR